VTVTMPLKQYLTYQHNVQRYFREHCDKYDGIIIPLSIAISFPSGTYGFVRALCAKDDAKQYAIDPRSALFQKTWNRTFVREPHRKMATVFGGPFSEHALARALTPEDFEDDDVIDELVRNCLNFQRRFRTSEDDQRKLNKYKKMLGLKALGELGDPQFLIPPYFQFSEIGDEWHEVAARCIASAVAQEDAIPIQPVMHFSQWEGEAEWRPCLAELKDQGIEAVWFYPNDFHEHNADVAHLTSYLQVVALAAEMKIKPYALFGGYYAIVLSYFGLKGFGNGIGYGEWRDSGYHRGGSASTRVYILKLHRFIDAPAAQALIDQDPEYFGEDTDILANYVQSNQPLDDMSQEEALDHFMECRKLEVDFVMENDLATASGELRETLKRLDEMPLERERYGDSLETWADVLEGESE